MKELGLAIWVKCIPSREQYGKRPRVSLTVGRPVRAAEATGYRSPMVFLAVAWISDFALGEVGSETARREDSHMTCRWLKRILWPNEAI